MKEVTLHGKILEAVDYNSSEILNLPGRRTQKFVVELNEDFPNIIYLKNKTIKIVIDGDLIRYQQQ